MKIRSALLLFAVTVIFFPLIASAGSVSLEWDPSTQSELAGYYLCYGTASGQYSAQVDVGNVTTYTVANLANGTYYFAVKAYVINGQESDFSNEVSTDVDTQPPIISRVASSEITGASASITWTTNEVADSQVEYGTTTSYGSSTTLDSSFLTAHSQSLGGLTAATTYHYRVKSKDVTGNLATSADYTFTTAVQSDATQPPKISNVASSEITGAGATITWTTNQAADSQVEYGTTTSYSSSTMLDSSFLTYHSQSLSGLTASTTYHYRVKSKDATSNLAVSGDNTFVTTAASDIITGLVAAYTFDEGTGSESTDVSANGNTASIHSATWADGKYGKALSFNGIDSFVVVGTNGLPSMNEPKTVSYWVYMAKENASLKTMLTLANSELGASLQYVYKNSEVGVLGFENNWMVVGKLPSLNSWRHFGYVFDGSQNRFYIDGNLVSTSTIQPPEAPVTSFQVGCRIDGSQYFEGSIDDLRIYNRALTQDELKLAMDTPVVETSVTTDSETETIPIADNSMLPIEAIVHPVAKPVVNIQLEHKTYRQGETVNASALWVSNPSNESRDVELKTWIELPGFSPISLSNLSVAEKHSLTPRFNQNFGVMPLLEISGEAPAGTCHVGARLVDPVTGDVLSEDIKSFAIVTAKAARSITQSVPDLVLESYIADSRVQYLIENKGATSADIEVKVWFETPDGTAIPAFSVGADGLFVLPVGSEITLDPLASLQGPAKGYILKARILDSASGEILQNANGDGPK